MNERERESAGTARRRGRAEGKERGKDRARAALGAAAPVLLVYVRMKTVAGERRPPQTNGVSAVQL